MNNRDNLQNNEINRNVQQENLMNRTENYYQNPNVQNNIQPDQNGYMNGNTQPENSRLNSNNFANNENEILSDSVYELVKQFKKRHPLTIAWRLKKNSKVIADHLNPGEKVRYAFAAQKDKRLYNFYTTCIVAITDKRLLIGQKRVVFGYFYYSITPDLYNDTQIKKGIFWGDVIIDTLNELVHLSKIAPSALDEIETNISTFMMQEKRKYRNK